MGLRALFLPLLLFGCDRGPSVPAVPDAVSIGEPEDLPDPLFPGHPETVSMLVFDGSGVPIAGAPFRVVATGAVSPLSGFTDEDGRAEVRWVPTSIGTASFTLTSGEASRTLNRTVEERRAATLTVLGPQEVGAGEIATFGGLVLDQRGDGLSEVVVTVADRDASTVSDAEGAFRNLGVTAPGPVGPWTPRFHAGGVEASAGILVVAGPPSQAQLGMDETPSFFAGEVEPVHLRIMDGFGNGVAGVGVSLSVDRGSLGTDEGLTGPDGWVVLGPWETPEIGGPAHLEIRAGELAVSRTVEVEPDFEVATIAVLQGRDPHAVPGGRVRVETVIEALGADGRRAGEVPIDVTIAGGRFTEDGRATARIRTDAQGQASMPEWRVDPDALEVRVSFKALRGSGGAQIEVETGPEQLSIHRVGGNGQVGEVRSPLSDGLRVRVEDPMGRPVWDVPVRFEAGAEGHGTFEPEMATTDRDGNAIAHWTLGPSIGLVQALARIEGGPEVQFDASAEAAFAWVIDGVSVGQAVQDLDRSVPLHAGTDVVVQAFIRWTPRAPVADVPRRTVVQVLDGGSVVHEAVMTRPPDIPQAPSNLLEWGFDMTSRAVVPGAIVRPGMGLRVVIDPDGNEIDPDARDSWPRGGAFVPEVVESPPPLRIHLVPVHDVNDGRMGDVEGRVPEYVQFLQAMMDRSHVEVSVAEPFQWSGEPVRMDQTSSWIPLISTLAEARNASSMDDRFWYGVVDPLGTSGIAGIGYIGRPVALGWDRRGVGQVLAHELGHNMGRRHAPCGAATRLDPNYPVPGGRIGGWGRDAHRGLNFSPEAGDIMSYCYHWISAYTRLGFESGIRALFGSGSALGQAARAGGTAALRIWGYRDGSEWKLMSGYEAPVNPAQPVAGGESTLEVVLVDESGAEFHRSLLLTVPISHADGESFSGSVPLEAARRASEIRIVQDGVGTVARRARADAPSAVSVLPDGEIQWLGGPGLALIRDSEGQITGILTGDGRVESGIVEAHDGFGRSALIPPGTIGPIELR